MPPSKGMIHIFPVSHFRNPEFFDPGVQKYLTRSSLREFAREIDLDTRAFEDCREYRKLFRKVISDFESGVKSGVKSGVDNTPLSL